MQSDKLEQIEQKIKDIFSDLKDECKKNTNKHGTVIIVWEGYLNLIQSKVMTAINETLKTE